MKYQLALVLGHHRVAEHYKTSDCIENDPDTIQALLQMASTHGLTLLHSNIMAYCIDKEVC